MAAAAAVEKALSRSGAAILWVTHDEGQPGRVGGRVYDLVPGVVSGAGASGGGRTRRGEGENDGDDDDESGPEINSNNGSAPPPPPVVVISPGKLVGGDWVGPKRGRE